MSEYLIKNVASTDYIVGPLATRVFVTTGNALRTVTLPDATQPRRSRVLTIKKVDSGTGTIAVVGVKGQTIDGAAGLGINKQFQSLVLTTDGSNWQTIGGVVSAGFGPNGESLQFQMNTELITLAAAATTDSVANLLPANSLIMGIAIRVVTVIPTAATFTYGDPTTAARFGTGIAVAAGTTDAQFLQFNTANTNAQGPVQVSAAKVRITPNLQPATATGQVRVTVFYVSMVPPSA